MSNHQDRVLVAFLVEQNGEVFYERLHAQPLGQDLYCLDNSPFYVYGVSFADVVFAPCVDGVPTFNGIVGRRGHSTYRVRLPVGLGHNTFLARWPDFQKLGCTFEGSGANARRHYSIDVPPGVDVLAVYGLLEEGEACGAWVFEEANYCSGDKRDSHDH